MPVTNEQINALRNKIDDEMTSCQVKKLQARNDLHNLNSIMTLEVEDDEGNIIESLPVSRDNPSRKMTEEDRTRLYDKLLAEYSD